MQCFVHIEPVTIPATHNIVGLYHKNINLQARAINSKWDLHSYLSYRQVGLAIKNLLGVYSVHSALMHSRLLDSPRWWCKHCCIEPPVTSRSFSIARIPNTLGPANSWT